MLRVLHQNIASLLSKQELLEITLQELQEKHNDPDVICLSETFVKMGHEGLSPCLDKPQSTQLNFSLFKACTDEGLLSVAAKDKCLQSSIFCSFQRGHVVE
ncbi:hypothetical protein HW555_007203 [Spodoptera exigua]|uniref:Uncharacterized protein n=1 Tax=Spodoptera exigua TaxID=7107 RepID=A0A835L3V4_SPOEX|nr:hypothetical protein HW555_007203 [Spodoptera exigua]